MVIIVDDHAPPLPSMCGVVVPKVEGVVEPVADTGLGDVGLFGEVEEKADVVLKENMNRKYTDTSSH